MGGGFTDEFIIDGSFAGGQEGVVHVPEFILQPGGQPVTLDYSMEKTANGWKVYDVMVGGVSLVANYRTEFANAVRTSGIDGLIKDLQTKNRALAEKK